jgi:hypothetical protein
LQSKKLIINETISIDRIQVKELAGERNSIMKLSSIPTLVPHQKIFPSLLTLRASNFHKEVLVLHVVSVVKLIDPTVPGNADKASYQDKERDHG